MKEKKPAPAPKKSVPPDLWDTRRGRRISVTVLVGLGILAYANSIRGAFVLDDEVLIKENTAVKGAASLGQIFSQNIEAGAGRMTPFYRPLLTLSLKANYALGRSNPAGYHAANILFHIAATVALYAFLRLLLNSGFPAFLAAAFFAVHPVHTEAVAYVSGRSDPLALFFLLVAFILYLGREGTRSMVRDAAAGSFYALALLSRESAAMLPVLILLYHAVFRKKVEPRRGAVILAVTVLYAVLRAVLSKNLGTPAVVATTFFQRIPGFFVALANYLRLLLVPVGLHMEYGMPSFSWADPKTIAGLLLAVWGVGAAIAARRAPRVRFALLWFFVALLPVSNIFPINAYMAEHWLYVPSVGFFLLLAFPLDVLYRRAGGRIPALVLSGGLVLLWALLTVRQNETWRDPRVFYERILQFTPENSRIMMNLGNVHQERGQNDTAASYYRKAIELNPEGEVRAYSNLGSVYQKTGRAEEAIALYQKAIALNPGFPDAYNNLGNAYRTLGRREEAAAAFRKALEINPNLSDAQVNLASLLQGERSAAETIALYENAIRLNPQNEQGYFNLANFYLNAGDCARAIPFYQKVLELKPGFSAASNNLGLAYQACGRFSEAIDVLEKAIASDPDYKDAYNNLGVAYKAAGRKNEAIAVLKKLIERDPRYASAYRNLAVTYYEMGEFGLAVSYADQAVREGGRLPEDFKKALEAHRGGSV